MQRTLESQENGKIKEKNREKNISKSKSKKKKPKCKVHKLMFNITSNFRNTNVNKTRPSTSKTGNK